MTFSGFLENCLSVISKCSIYSFICPDYKHVAFKFFAVGKNRNRGGRQVFRENLIKAKIVDI